MNLIAITVALLADVPEETLTLAEARPLAFAKTHHVQGLAIDEKFVYLSSVERSAESGWLFVFDRASLGIESKHRLALGPQYHPGGMQRRGSTLSLPLAEYRAKSSATLLVIQWSASERGKMQPTVTRTLPVADHIGGLAVDEAGRFYAGNWDCKEIRVLNSSGEEIRSIPNPSGVAYQDFEWHAGILWCAGNDRSRPDQPSVVDLIDAETGLLRKRYSLAGKRASGGSDFAHEGFTKEGDHLWFCPEDGPHTILYRFDLPSP